VSDTYTVAQASSVLGLSQKRVRQLIQEGKLEQVEGTPVRVSQAQVLDLRQARDTQGKPSANPRAQDSLDRFQAVLDEMRTNNQRAISALEHSMKLQEVAYLERLATAEAERARLQAELEAMRAQDRRGAIRRALFPR
jgi:excisionase family DNA binding protein